MLDLIHNHLKLPLNLIFNLSLAFSAHLLRHHIHFLSDNIHQFLLYLLQFLSVSLI